MGFVALDHVPYTIESHPLSSWPRCSLQASSSASGRLPSGSGFTNCQMTIPEDQKTKGPRSTISKDFAGSVLSLLADLAGSVAGSVLSLLAHFAGSVVSWLFVLTD